MEWALEAEAPRARAAVEDRVREAGGPAGWAVPWQRGLRDIASVRSADTGSLMHGGCPASSEPARIAAPPS